MTEKMGLIGPEVSDPSCPRLPARPRRHPGHEQGDSQKDARGMARPAGRRRDPGRCGARGGSGVPISNRPRHPAARMDIVSIVGVEDAVNRVGSAFGRVIRPSTATDLLTLSAGSSSVSSSGGSSSGVRGQDRWERRRTAGFWRNRLLLCLAPFASSATRRPRRATCRGFRAGRLRRYRRDQCRQLAAGAARRRAGAEDLPGRLHRLLGAADHCLGGRLAHVQDERGGPDRRRGRRRSHSGPCRKAAVGGPTCPGSVSRSPMRCRDPADHVWLLRHASSA